MYVRHSLFWAEALTWGAAARHTQQCGGEWTAWPRVDGWPESVQPAHVFCPTRGEASVTRACVNMSLISPDSGVHGNEIIRRGPGGCYGAIAGGATRVIQLTALGV
jgi:hypothetical protein